MIGLGSICKTKPVLGFDNYQNLILNMQKCLYLGLLYSFRVSYFLCQPAHQQVQPILRSLLKTLLGSKSLRLSQVMSGLCDQYWKLTVRNLYSTTPTIYTPVGPTYPTLSVPSPLNNVHMKPRFSASSPQL